MIILGITCYYHDSAAALCVDGELVAAVEEERFSRRKHDQRFPLNAIRYCLAAARIRPADIDVVAFYEKPLRKFDRQLRIGRHYGTAARHVTRRAARFQLREGLRLEETLESAIGFRGRMAYIDHHMSHASSAYYCSGFQDAAVLIVDGVGEWATTSQLIGSGATIVSQREILYPHSLGLLYAALTSFLGFQVNSDEYKVMGLASYGQPTLCGAMEKLIHAADDGSFELDLRYFSFAFDEARMFSDRLVELLGPPRHAADPISSRHMDIAASLQLVTEDIIVNLVRSFEAITDSPNLCMAGGVGYNCVANSRVVERTKFKRAFVQPAAGDSGCAVGAALYVYHAEVGRQTYLPMPGYDTCLGPAFSASQIQTALDDYGLEYRRYDEEGLCADVAALIWGDCIVGWFQGRMEFGPRALGKRSILANPCNPAMVDVLNSRVKFREDFRPFAPAVIEERAEEYFELNGPSPYMLFTARVRDSARALIPAVTHVDGTARVQTVEARADPLFHRLIAAFGCLSGVPVVINTSFNIRGEPIVCTPEDAVVSFLHCDLDYLVIGPFIAGKTVGGRSPKASPPVVRSTGKPGNEPWTTLLRLGAGAPDWLAEVVRTLEADPGLTQAAPDDSKPGATFIYPH
jgi:carbamoyltransferase